MLENGEDPFTTFDQASVLTLDQQKKQDGFNERFNAKKESYEAEVSKLRKDWEAAKADWKEIRSNALGVMIDEHTRLGEERTDLLSKDNLSPEESLRLDQIDEKRKELAYGIENNELDLEESDITRLEEIDRILERTNPKDPYGPIFYPPEN